MKPIYLVIPLFLIAAFQLAPHWSLLFGLSCALLLTLRAPVINLAKIWSTRFLQASIVLIGASLNFKVIADSGPQLFFTTLLSIVFIMLVGSLLGRVFKIPSPLRQLLSAGTAICGGSAIGALSGVLKADSLSIATAMGLVFLLNAVSVFIFPPIAHALQLSQEQFGIWAALAIHDTSAVVAAAQIYGEKSLEFATTLKLTRALWIIPLCFVMSLKHRGAGQQKIPWFIFLFIAASLLFTFTPPLAAYISPIKLISRTGFSWTLFLIGLSLNRAQLKEIKINSFFFALTLWFITLGSTLYFVLSIKE